MQNGRRIAATFVTFLALAASTLHAAAPTLEERVARLERIVSTAEMTMDGQIKQIIIGTQPGSPPGGLLMLESYGITQLFGGPLACGVGEGRTELLKEVQRSGLAPALVPIRFDELAIGQYVSFRFLARQIVPEHPGVRPHQLVVCLFGPPTPPGSPAPARSR